MYLQDDFIANDVENMSTIQLQSQLHLVRMYARDLEREINQRLREYRSEN